MPRPLSRKLIVAACLLHAASALAQTEPRRGLLTDAVPVDLADRAADMRLAEAVRFVSVDLSVFGSANAPPDASTPIELDLDLLRDAAGRPFVAVPDGVSVLPSGRIAWTGRIAGLALSAVTFVIDRVDGTLTGSISYPNGGTFRILSVGGGVHVVLKLDTSRFPDDRGIDPPEPSAPGPGPGPEVRDGATIDSGDRIDALVVYTPAARVAAGGTSSMQALIDLAVTETNQSYANSGITPRLRLVGSAEVAYTESGNWTTDINRLQNPSDGYIDTVHTLRDTTGADLVSMIMEDTAFCGLAYTIGGPTTANAPYAFTLVARTCATGYYSFAHELGHIQGARHDWFVDPTNNSPYTYNHGFYYGTSWRTIMSYIDGCSPCTRIQYWSNPDVTYGGVAMGRAEGLSQAADNRKTLNNTAYYVANFRAEVSTVPGAFNKTLPTNGATGVLSSPTLSWGASSGATGYEYCVDTTNDNACNAWASTGTNTSVGLSNLASNTPYYWHVRATNAGGATYADGSSTAFWSFTTISADSFEPDGTAAQASVLASGSPQSHTFHTNGDVDWARFVVVSGQQYTMYTGSLGAGVDTVLYLYGSDGTTLLASDDDSAGNLASRIVYTASVTGNYYVKVVQFNANTGQGAFTLTLEAAPTAFSKALPTNGATGQSTSPTLSWGAASGATGYEYCIDTTNDNACSGWTSTGTYTSVGLNGLSTNTPYYWQVRATDVGGTTYANGSSTAFWSFTTFAADSFEPDDTSAQASVLSPAAPQPHTFHVNGDVDWARIAVVSGLQYTMYTGGLGAGVDTIMYLYGTDGTTLLASDDDGGGNVASRIVYTATATGNYYVKVVQYNPASGLGAYTLTLDPAAQGPFSKTSPSNFATGQSTSPTLSWGVSAGATGYEYCYDATNDNACSVWTSTGTNTSVGLTGLGLGTTYYWQVRAQNGGGTTYANGSTAFWNFATLAVPGAFGKTAPANAATGQSIGPTLSWAFASGATGYEYCIDTTNDNACSVWTSTGTNTSVALSSLGTSTSYYWHVRATNAAGTTYADGSGTAFWGFTTQAAGTPPTVVTLSATNLASTGATLNGTVNPNGNITTARFDYGQTLSYGSQVTAAPAPGSGISPVAVSAAVSGVTCNTVYHFRVSAASGTVANGSDLTFTTAPCPAPGLLGAVRALVVDPANGDTVYAGTSSGIYKTVNGGASWIRIDSGLPYSDVTSLAIDPNAPCRIMAGIDSHVSNTFSQIVNTSAILAETTNCGISWTTPTGGPAGTKALSVAFTTENPASLYVTLWVNTKSGGIDTVLNPVTRTRWQPGVATTDYSYFSGVRAVATDPATPCTAYVGHYLSGSVERNTGCSGSMTWSSVGAELSAAVNSIVVHPTNQSTLLAGTSDGQIHRKLDDASPWVSVGSGLGAINSLVYQPGSALVAYAAGANGILYKSSDGGGTWAPASTVGGALSSAAMSAAAPTVVYAGGNSFVVKLTQGAAPPGAFNKSLPANGATGVSTSPTLSWGAASGATGYEYCIDTTNDNACSAWTSTGTNTSVGLSGLSTNTLYYWHVRATNAGGTTYANGSSTTYWSFTTQVAAPGAFGKSLPTNGATGVSTSPTLSWGAASGSTGYEYCIDTTNDNACSVWTSTGTSTSVGLSGLATNTPYYWHVRATNAGGTTYANAGSTAFWSFTTQISGPGAFGKSLPANGATGVSTSPTLSWGAASGATGYEYCIDTTNDNACSAWTSTGTNTSVGLNGLASNTPYYWHVRATNAGGTTFADGGSTTFWSFTTQVAVPGAFGKSLPANGATGQSTGPTLSWGSASGATGYEYCIDTTNDNACSVWTGTGTNTSVGLNGLASNTPYYWHVRATNAGGPTYADGGSTAFWSFTTQNGNSPGAFGKVLPYADAPGQSPSPLLLWDAASGATGYEYCIDTTNDNACSGWTSTGTSTSVVLLGLGNSTTYYWQVRATSGGGTTYAEGSSTAFRSFTTMGLSPRPVGTGPTPGSVGPPAPPVPAPTPGTRSLGTVTRRRGNTGR